MEKLNLFKIGEINSPTGTREALNSLVTAVNALLETQAEITASQETRLDEMQRQNETAGANASEALASANSAKSIAESVSQGLSLHEDRISNLEPIALTAEEITAQEEAEALRLAEERRKAILTAYRAYQCATAYGEFGKVLGVDEYIATVYGGTHNADIPPALLFFMGECTFEDSGLIRQTDILDEIL
jgi:hypothetical protein